MIEAMRKYSFLVYHRDYTEFLDKLQTLGVMHIQSGQSELNTENTAKITKINRLKAALSDMKERQQGAHSKADVSQDEDLLNIIEKKNETVTSLQQDIAGLDKEYESILPWGEFNPDKITGIKDAGYNVQFLVCNETDWNEEWRSLANIELVNKQDGELFLLSISNDDKLQDSNLTEVNVEHPISYYNTKITALKDQLSHLNNDLDDISTYAPELLEANIKDLESELDFTRAFNSGNKVADDKLIVLLGWVPAEQKDEFSAKMDAEDVFYLTEEPSPSDDMPIKLKNNRFARLFEPISELYSFPKSNELDLTPFFAPFYMLFFGFCLGDAGYGILIILASLFAMTKVSAKVKPLLWLIFFLGVSTTIMGVLGGSAFGIAFADMKATSVWLKSYQKWILSTDNLMVLSLLLGYCQVVFGMVLKTINLKKAFGFKYAVSQIGWLLVIGVAIPAYGLGMENMIDVSIANTIACVTGGLGGLLALFYNKPGKNPLVNFGSGLWDTYGMASGLLGDVLSYIRLFALGLSSAILGKVFNMLAFSLAPHIPVLGILVTIMILIFGHSLNFFIAALGSFVHPLRLTFVEFYKNAGFEGGGNKYIPFKK